MRYYQEGSDTYLHISVTCSTLDLLKKCSLVLWSILLNEGLQATVDVADSTLSSPASTVVTRLKGQGRTWHREMHQVRKVGHELINSIELHNTGLGWRDAERPTTQRQICCGRCSFLKQGTVHGFVSSWWISCTDDTTREGNYFTPCAPHAVLKYICENTILKSKVWSDLQQLSSFPSKL